MAICVLSAVSLLLFGIVRARETIRPTVISAVISSNGTTVTVTHSEAVTGTAGFTVTPSGGASTLGSAASPSTKVRTYEASRTIGTAETVTLNFSGGGVTDNSGNVLSNFTGTAVTNNSAQGGGGDSTPPTVTSADWNGTELVVGLSEAVTGTVATGWTITASGGAVTVSGGSGSGTNELTLTTSRASGDETGTLAYSSTTGDLKDTANNDLATFSGFSMTIPVAGGASDSFEAGDPTGWDDDMFYVTEGAGREAGSDGSGSKTVTEETPPTGGGTHTYRQIWQNSGPFPGEPDWLVHEFTGGAIAEGETFEIEYYLKYHNSFDEGSTGIVKSIIIRNESGHQEIYINSHHFGRMIVAMQNVDGGPVIYDANANGGAYTMPHGSWVHFRFRFKADNEALGGSALGTLTGWVNGVKRWDYTGIRTHNSGNLYDFNLSSVFNAPVVMGANQRRWWDLFVVRRGL